ncbi:right-handed parallel beta-helix repeat-containing protein [Tunturiibacter gelidoferens]|uniref:Phosphotransferase system IIB component n=1 Tax=Tunturiibacter gelidiferens TaxID=3069689 RepID=A0A9X0QGF5_9BACT|nr:right-handed parallel beta-helix repeat-containing protein [Edaphobacter lichenicola]MBB5329958.1 phosphotransferase system IIB component [Edaphobacter lichenicola]
MRDFLAVSTIRAKNMFSDSRIFQTRLSPRGVRLAVYSLWLLLAGCAFGQTCTQTFTPANVGTSPYPGSNVNTAVQNGNGSTVLCFSSGTYSAGIDIFAAHPSGVVTLKPATGATVNMGLFNLNGVSNVTITGFSGSSSSGGMLIQVSGQGGNSNITFSDNAMTSFGVTVSNNTLANANILITNNTFVGFATAGEEDRMRVVGNTSCPDGITISNNLISGGESDGIQYGSSCGTQIINNEISNIHESSCNGIHCDAIQDAGGGVNTVISGNYIHDVSDCFLLDDGSTNTTITNNVCNTDGQDNFWMQFGGAQTIKLDHNTIRSTSGAQYGNDHNNNPSSNVTFTNNIFYSVPSQNSGQPPSGTTNINFNLCPTSGCSGANSIGGSTPTFTGGTSPTTYAGFALTSDSAGHNASSGGTDIGINTTTVVSGKPNPPTNLTASTQ